MIGRSYLKVTRNLGGRRYEHEDSLVVTPRVLFLRSANTSNASGVRRPGRLCILCYAPSSRFCLPASRTRRRLLIINLRENLSADFRKSDTARTRGTVKSAGNGSGETRAGFSLLSFR